MRPGGKAASQPSYVIITSHVSNIFTGYLPESEDQDQFCKRFRLKHTCMRMMHNLPPAPTPESRGLSSPDEAGLSQPGDSGALVIYDGQNDNNVATQKGLKTQGRVLVSIVEWQSRVKVIRDRLSQYEWQSRVKVIRDQLRQYVASTYKRLSLFEINTIQNALGHLRLSVIWPLVRKLPRATSPEARVALLRNYPAAFIAASAHLLPLLAIAAIAYFTFNDYYIGRELSGISGQDDQKFLALQFTAKLLELLVTFSLGTIIFTMLRHELALGEGVPLAGLTSGLQFSSPNFLWSQELWALLFARFSSAWKKAFFIFLLVFFTCYSVVVAPSTASAIIPNLRDNLISFFSKENIYTAGLGDASWRRERTPMPAYVRGTNAHIGIWAYPRLFPANNFATPYVIPQLSANFTVATMAHHAVVDGIVMGATHWNWATWMTTYNTKLKHRAFAWRQYNAYSSTLMSAPFAHTRCASKTYVIGSMEAPLFPNFLDMDFNVTNIPTPPEMDTWMASTLPSLVRPEVFWFDLDGLTAVNASIGFLVGVPTSDESIVNLYDCVTDARWVELPHALDNDRLVGMTGQVMPPVGDSARGNELSTGWGRRCHVGPSYTQYINPRIRNTNRTVLQDMLSATSFWKEGPGPRDWQSSGYLPYLEAVVTILIVNGMARTAPYATPFHQLINQDGQWWLDFIPDGTSPQGRPSKTAYVVTGNVSSYVTFNLTADIRGYAYTRNDSVTYTAIVILFLYLPFGLGIMLWTSFRGITSTSWDSASELLVLALKSEPPPPEVTAGTSTGIPTLNPLKRRYCVIVKGEVLELRLVEDRVSDVERLKINTVYS
ncbi:hypothetical protein BJ170DRAFT_735555 [Xylariales sp. AK1849]|nr:hypothetical protein BJ170DRAFT_735555 [Xylariales sp. AK1849]